LRPDFCRPCPVKPAKTKYYVDLLCEMFQRGHKKQAEETPRPLCTLVPLMRDGRDISFSKVFALHPAFVLAIFSLRIICFPEIATGEGAGVAREKRTCLFSRSTLPPEPMK
jgi:hypothetical protein